VIANKWFPNMVI